MGKAVVDIENPQSSISGRGKVGDVEEAINLKWFYVSRA